jgi:5-methylcytosine-specific restriction endonuclease McrA
MTDDSIPQKRCNKCYETKPLEMFSKHTGKKDGHQYRCKACAAKYREEIAEKIKKKVQAYNQANAEKIKERKQAYNKANAEKIRERKKRYNAEHREAKRARERARRAANPEEIRAYYRAYRAANLEKLREMERGYRAAKREQIRARGRAYYRENAEAILKARQAYRAANRDKVRLIKSAYRAAHPEWSRTQDHNRRARIRGNEGSFTPEQIAEMHIVQAGICAYCARQYDPDDLTIDHIIPSKQGGSNYIANICLACPRCNFSKNNRTPEQWTDRWYYHED